MISKRDNNKFFNGGNWHNNAVLSWGPIDGSFYQYTEGYFYSANLIAGSLLRDDFISESYRSTQDENGGLLFDMSKDECIFPMIFLYRHYIELSLKHLLRKIYNLRKCYNKKYSKEMNNNHSLEKLSSILQQEYNELLIDFALQNNKEYLSYKNEFKILLETCEELNYLDENSIAVRYPADKNDNSYLLKEPPVNIELFMSRMQDIRKIFVWGYEMMEVLSEYYHDAANT